MAPSVCATIIGSAILLWASWSFGHRATLCQPSSGGSGEVPMHDTTVARATPDLARDPPTLTLAFGLCGSAGSWCSRRGLLERWWVADAPIAARVFFAGAPPPDCAAPPPRGVELRTVAASAAAAMLADEGDAGWCGLQLPLLYRELRAEWYVLATEATAFAVPNLLHWLPSAAASLPEPQRLRWYVGAHSESRGRTRVDGRVGSLAGGVLLSRGLAAQLARPGELDGCGRRLVAATATDDGPARRWRDAEVVIRSCVAELGVGLVHAAGLHPMDANEARPLLEAHPVAPLLSLSLRLPSTSSSSAPDDLDSSASSASVRGGAGDRRPHSHTTTVADAPSEAAALLAAMRAYDATGGFLQQSVCTGAAADDAGAAALAVAAGYSVRWWPKSKEAAAAANRLTAAALLMVDGSAAPAVAAPDAMAWDGLDVGLKPLPPAVRFVWQRSVRSAANVTSTYRRADGGGPTSIVVTEPARRAGERWGAGVAPRRLCCASVEVRGSAAHVRLLEGGDPGCSPPNFHLP